jgi:isocitrate dehydrogenase (NAD+)
MHHATLIPGDGIGPEVTQSARDIIAAAGVAITWEVAEAGMRAGNAGGHPLPPPVFESIARTKLVLKGPTQTPFGDAYPVQVGDRIYPSVAIALRKELKLFVNVRPARNLPGIQSRFENVDIVIFRENSEDLYIGQERMVDADTAEAVKIITRGASERVARFAFDYMQRTGRKKLTAVHKSNVLKLTDGLFLKPESFDCLVLPNLYGDIVSDLAAGLVGGLGVAPGANIGDECAMFEAVHGSAPDIAGKDMANPVAVILSAVMLLRYIGEGNAADRIDAALTSVLQEGKHVTRDLGGNAGTRGMTQAIIDRLKAV